MKLTQKYMKAEAKKINNARITFYGIEHVSIMANSDTDRKAMIALFVGFGYTCMRFWYVNRAWYAVMEK